ncbi:MAG: ricin-type beta-trefoil lectin domain protein [Deltaproteobacteria bacterium]|nr:ricin-type beta-trefoil lectin domain protein [Deltaproteobacteria bacterium]
MADHFYTTSEREVQVANANGYRTEGEAIYIHTTPGNGRVPLYRYLGSNRSDHFYTTRGGGAPLIAGDYQLEAIAGYVYTVPGNGRVRLYRYWSPSNTDHFYTTRGGGAPIVPGTLDYRLEGEVIWAYTSGAGTMAAAAASTASYTAPPTTSSGSGAIRNASGKCLDVHAGCMYSNGCNVQVWDCNNTSQQTWTVSGGQIRNANGKCLDVHAGCMNSNGCNVQVWDCNKHVSADVDDERRTNT